MPAIPRILIDDQHAALNTQGMNYKEFPSDFQRIRYFSLLVVQKAPLMIKEMNLLEQQISEVIKNGVKHGNHCDPRKMVRIWYRFTEHQAHIIVQDEGEGFKDIEKWNTFNAERAGCLDGGDFEKMFQYASWRGKNSDEHDGGNALFAAVEYWNGGYVFSSRRNTVGAIKNFPQYYYSIRST